MMKYFMVLTSLIAATSAGNLAFGGGNALGGFGGGNAVGGFGSGNAGYSGGGAGGYQGNAGGNTGYSAPAVGGFTGGGVGGFGGGFNNLGGGGGFAGTGGLVDGGSFGGNVGGGQIRKFVSVHVGPEEISINTEVILPEQPQQKTLVYVLVKKQESTSNVRVRGPSPTKPSKPEVYFIRYKDQIPNQAGLGGDIGGHGGGVGVGPAYGAPQAQVGPHGGGY